MFHRKTNAGDVCSRIVAIGYPSLNIDAAARMMREQHVGCLVIVEEVAADERRVVGMLTDRDIVTGVVARQRDAQSLRVGDVMSHDVISVREDDTLLDVLAVMRQKGVRRVPVVGSRELLVGLIAIDDVLEVLSEEVQALAAAIAAAQRHEHAVGV